MADTQQPIKFTFNPTIRVHNTPKVAPHPHSHPLTIDDINAEIAGMGIEFLPHKEERDPLLDSFLDSKPAKESMPIKTDDSQTTAP